MDLMAQNTSLSVNEASRFEIVYLSLWAHYDLQSNISVEDHKDIFIFYFKEIYLFELVLV